MCKRLVPEEPFPAYAFVPGHSPHPLTDPAGHSFGKHPPAPPALEAERWSSNKVYLYGMDLFNAGYYWEAHEQWEGLWHACGRRGVTATLLKALIRLTAAGVKVREGRPQGVRSHAQRAAELLAQVAQELSAGGSPTHHSYLGLDLAEVRRQALRVAAQPPLRCAETPVEVVFDFVLQPVS